MTGHQSIVEALRGTRKTLYLFTALYVGVGFLIGIPAALAGDRLGALLGFLFISGALCGALVFHGMSRLAIRVSAIGDCLEGVKANLDRLLVAPRPDSFDRVRGNGDAAVRTLDLAAVGPGDPDLLKAATLGQKVFPRLVAAVGRTPCEGPLDEEAEPTPAPATVAPEDLPFSARRGTEKQDAPDQTERELRTSFATCVREGDYAGALAVGERIAELFPNRAMTSEFIRIRPHLLRRHRLAAGRGAAG